MSDLALECDVLIVGGGPAGLSVAAALPDNVTSIIVHQDAEIGRPVRTSGGCWLEDVKSLNIPEDYYQVLDHLDVYSDNQEAHFEIKTNKLVVLNITDLYCWLARKSDTKQRVLLLATKFLSTKQTDDGRYISTVRSRNKKTSEIRSTYIVDGSGVRTAVLQNLGLADKPSRTGVGIEYEYAIGTNRSDSAILFVGSSILSGYGWVFPTADNKLRVGVGNIRPDTEVSPKDLMENFLASKEIQRFGLDLEGHYEVNAGTIPSIAYDPKLLFGNIIRVGDSANFATPTVGEGIRICIESGTELGVALGQAIDGQSPTPLQKFEVNCNKKFRKNYYFGFLANQRFSRYDVSDWDKSVRRLAHLSEAELVALLRSEFNLKMVLKASIKLLKSKLYPFR